MQPEPDHIRLYRIAWRWRALFSALVAFPLGWLYAGILAAQTLSTSTLARYAMHDSTRPFYYSDTGHLPEAVICSLWAALCTLIIARVKNPHAYWPAKPKL